MAGGRPRLHDDARTRLFQRLHRPSPLRRLCGPLSRSRADHGGVAHPVEAIARNSAMLLAWRRAPREHVLRDRRPAGLSRLAGVAGRSEEHTSELQSLMRISYAVFCLKKKIN